MRKIVIWFHIKMSPFTPHTRIVFSSLQRAFTNPHLFQAYLYPHSEAKHKARTPFFRWGRRSSETES